MKRRLRGCRGRNDPHFDPLERSGLREGEEYVSQHNHAPDDGHRLRSDVVVTLPGGQRIVIDSKLSLTAFNDYVNAETDVERELHLKRHLTSIRSHIRTLSGKEYHSAASSPLDYVVMFIPIEGALAVALQKDPLLSPQRQSRPTSGTATRTALDDCPTHCGECLAGGTPESECRDYRVAGRQDIR